MPDALSAFERIKKISNEGYTNIDESNKLRPHIGKRSMQSIKNTNKEQLIREHRLEESTNASDLSLLPERGIEEDVPDKIDQLDLHYVLLVCYHLVEHFE